LARLAQRLARACRPGVVGLHEEDRGPPQPDFRIGRVRRRGGGEVVERAGKIVPVLPQQRAQHEDVVRRVLARPRAQRRFGVTDEARIAFGHRQPKVAPAEAHGDLQIVGPRREPGATLTQLASDGIPRLDRQPLEDGCVVLGDIRRRRSSRREKQSAHCRERALGEPPRDRLHTRASIAPGCRSPGVLRPRGL
jgi:hypothetical protein